MFAKQFLTCYNSNFSFYIEATLVRFCFFVFMDGVVGMVTPYGLDDPVIECGGRGVSGEIFNAWPNRPRGPPIILCHGYPVCFAGLTFPGRGFNHSLLSRAKGNCRVELYSYAPFVPPW
jgi:hypothetical protein